MPLIVRDEQPGAVELFVRGGQVAHCPRPMCGGEIVYYAPLDDRRVVKCVLCERLFAAVEIETHNLVRWA